MLDGGNIFYIYVYLVYYTIHYYLLLFRLYNAQRFFTDILILYILYLISIYVLKFLRSMYSFCDLGIHIFLT